MTKFVSEEQVRLGYSQANNAAAAAKAIGVSPATFKRYAKSYGLYVTNQGGQGIKRKPKTLLRQTTEELLTYGSGAKSARLRERLIEEGYKKNECEECGLPGFWQDKPLTLHLDHIDGDHDNNVQSNLRLLCPNCHAQTPTYCRGQGKNQAGVAKR